jgi:hypothetical protein
MSLSSIAPEFYLFAATLLGIAILHRHTLSVALTSFKLLGPGFASGYGSPALRSTSVTSE